MAGQGDRTPGPARPQAIGAPYYVQPTAPQPLNYDAVYEQGQPVHIAWNSGMASCGGFVLSIYHGGSCSSGGLLQSNQQAGWASGTTQIELLGLALDQQYSWKVKPFIAANCGGDPLWPPCAKVKVKKHVAPPAATDQCQEVVFSGTVFKEVHHIEMHAVQGTFDFWYDAINIPDRFIVSYEGEILWNECVAGTDTIPLAYSGSTSIITVTVLPNCYALYQGDTEWSVKVSCP